LSRIGAVVGDAMRTAMTLAPRSIENGAAAIFRGFAALLRDESVEVETGRGALDVACFGVETPDRGQAIYSAPSESRAGVRRGHGSMALMRF
jgi:hypothetical protein